MPFFSDGLSDYFGINNGQGASTFSGFGGQAGPCVDDDATAIAAVKAGLNVDISGCSDIKALMGYCSMSLGAMTAAEVCPCSCGPGSAAANDSLPFNGEAFVGFDGAYLEAEDMDGESWNDPFTMTWATVSGSCAGTLVFSGKFAMGNYRNIDSSDFVDVQVSVDGAAAATVLELRGNGDGSNNAFAVDSDGDGVGDGEQLSTHARTLSAYIPGTMSTSVVLSITFAVNGVNEEIAMDDLKITCGPTVMHSPPPPRSPPMLASGDYQVWVTRDEGATATLISGGINDPSSTAGVTAGSDCYDPTLNSDGSLVAFRCKKKLHPSGYQPGSTADDEGWLYDQAANKLTLFAEMNVDDESACAGSSASKADLLADLSAQYAVGASNHTNKHRHAACGLCLTLPVPPSLLRSWGDDPVYTDAMPTSVTTSSCPFFAAVGILPGVNTIGVGADNPSMDGAGRFITYT